MPGYEEKEWKEYLEEIAQVNKKLDQRGFYASILYGVVIALFFALTLLWVVKQ